MEINKYVKLFEMARADLEGVVDVVKSGDFDKAASMYISKAKARGLDAKKVVVGLGSTFRTYEEMGPEEIKQLKDAIKEKLSGEMPEKKEKTTSKKKKKEEEEGEEVEKKKESAEMAKKGKKKPKTELIKAPKEELGEPEMKMEGTSYGRTGRLSLKDEILMRAGMISEQQMGSEGDAGGAYSSKKNKKKSKKFGKSMKGEKSSGGKGEVAKAKGKAPRKAENEEQAGEDREGLSKAPGIGNPGKYILGQGAAPSGGGSKYTGGSKGTAEGSGSKYTI